MPPSDSGSLPTNVMLTSASLVLLAGCNVVIGSGGMVVTGLLGPIGQAMQVDQAAAGQLLTVYAVAFAIGAPVVAVLAGRVCRKKLLFFALLACGLALLTAAWSPDFTTLAVARAASGLAAAVFVPNATAVASALTLPSQRGRAVSIVFGGFTLALVLGAPAGTWIGMEFGWRPTLAVLGVAAVLAAAALKIRLPGGIILPGATLASLRAVLEQPALRSTIGLNLLTAFGTFVLFAYAASAWPVLLQSDANAVAPALALFGIGSLLGNGVAAWAVDRFGATRAATGGLAATASAMAVLALGGWQTVSWAALVAWGMAGFIATTALQTRLVGALPALVPAALPLNSSAAFTGQALGAATGGLWLSHGSPWWGDASGSEATGLAWIASAALALAAWRSSALPTMSTDKDR